MNITDWIAIAAGIAAIAWVNWYFFLAEREAVSAGSGAGGVQEIAVAVEGGYSPAAIRVKRGAPVRLVFDRRETNSCSEEIVIPAFGIRRFLPAFQKTAVEFVPDERGTYEFTCGMSMLRGKVIVE